MKTALASNDTLLRNIKMFFSKVFNKNINYVSVVSKQDQGLGAKDMLGSLFSLRAQRFSTRLWVLDRWKL